MKKHGLTLGLCLAAALLAFGCSDDDSSDNKKPAGCTATVCSGDTLIVCNADGTTTSQACANGCDAATNQCKADSGNQGGNEGGNQGGNEGGNQGGNEGGNQGGAIVDGNSLPVPSSQNNTAGAECSDSFVEHCDGNTVVYCNEGEVDRMNCTGDSLKCAARLIEDDGDAYNFANCYEPCTNAGEKKQVCSYDEFYSEILMDVVCANTSKGLLLMEDLDGSMAYCGNVCQNNTCETNKPCGDVTYDGKCDGDSFVYCGMGMPVGDEMPEEVLNVVDCGGYGLTCSVESMCE